VIPQKLNPASGEGVAVLLEAEGLDGLLGVLVGPDSMRRSVKREGLVIRGDEESVCIGGTTKAGD
jgi:hypothetical protein